MTTKAQAIEDVGATYRAVQSATAAFKGAVKTYFRVVGESSSQTSDGTWINFYAGGERAGGVDRSAAVSLLDGVRDELLKLALEKRAVSKQSLLSIARKLVLPLKKSVPFKASLRVKLSDIAEAEGEEVDE